MKWTAFLDESGDHGLMNLDVASPFFVLAACVYKTDDYLHAELPNFGRLKQQFWRHEGVILRAYDIRKKHHDFSFCTEGQKREALFNAIMATVIESSAIFISAVIDKPKFKSQYLYPENCYYLACKFVLERIFMMTRGHVHIVFESRGKREDREVGHWCRAIADGDNALGDSFVCTFDFVQKRRNVAGLQMADLICAPIAGFVKNPQTTRKDWLAVRDKLHRNSDNGNFLGYGLKIFPP